MAQTLASVTLESAQQKFNEIIKRRKPAIARKKLSRSLARKRQRATFQHSDARTDLSRKVSDASYFAAWEIAEDESGNTYYYNHS